MRLQKTYFVITSYSIHYTKLYDCEDNPTCNFMTWDMPVDEKCPRCGSSLFHKGGKFGKLVCHKLDCGFEKELSKDES